MFKSNISRLFASANVKLAYGRQLLVAPIDWIKKNTAQSSILNFKGDNRDLENARNTFEGATC